MNICWLIGCKEKSDDGGYIDCHCGKTYYMDYESFNPGIFGYIKSGFSKLYFQTLKDYIDDRLYKYIRYCNGCHKVNYLFGLDINKDKHDSCVPF